MTALKKVAFLARRGSRCAVMGVALPPLNAQVAHVVPFALGRTAEPQQSPFFAVVSLFSPTRARRVWERAGDRRVNDDANLLVLSPNLHSMLDDGEMFLLPHMASPVTLGLTVRFRIPPEHWPTNEDGNGSYLVALNNRYIVGVQHGDGMLHRIKRSL
jgi:hypothetical protein